MPVIKNISVLILEIFRDRLKLNPIVIMVTKVSISINTPFVPKGSKDPNPRKKEKRVTKTLYNMPS